NCYTHIRSGEFRSVHVRQPQVYVSQTRAMENRVRKVATEKFHSAGLRFCQISSGQNSFRHVRVSQVGFAKICPGEVRARQLGLAQVRAFEVSAPQNRSAEIDALQVGAGKVGASQVRPRASFLPSKEKRMRLKNVRQPLGVVLNTLCFSQSHGLLSAPLSNALFYSLRTSLTSVSRLFHPATRKNPPPLTAVCDSVLELPGCPEGERSFEV